VKVKEKDGRYYAPASATTRAAWSSCSRSSAPMNANALRTVGDVLFVGTVGEEELGDLRGVKALFRDHPDIDGFISLDGDRSTACQTARPGSHRYEAIFKGPGGHSFSAFGLPSAIHAWTGDREDLGGEDALLAKTSSPSASCAGALRSTPSPATRAWVSTCAPTAWTSCSSSRRPSSRTSGTRPPKRTGAGTPTASAWS